MPRNVAIFDDVEVLDFCGPFEVFSVAARLDGADAFDVYTVAEELRPIVARGGLSVNPHSTLGDCPTPDIVVVPGGYGARREQHNRPVLDWIRNWSKRSELTLSVCTGAALFSKAGLLDGKKATTFHRYIDELQRITPKATILRNTRFVDNGQVITTAGISAGIDGALHVVANLRGEDVAQQTAQHMEYDKWQPNQGLVVKAATPATAGAALVDKSPAEKAKGSVRGRKK